MGSTLLSSSFWRVHECLCVSAFSAGTISVEGKEHRETSKELLCTFEWNDLKKGFSWKKTTTFYSGFHIQKGTYPITKLPSSISTSINPSSILRPVSVLCVEALPWAKSMSLVVVNVGHVSECTVSQPFVTFFWLYCKNSKDHATRNNTFNC